MMAVNCFILSLIVGCNSGGGGGECSKVKRLVGKWIHENGYAGNKSKNLPQRKGYFKRKNFFPGHFHPYNHVCILFPVHELLEGAGMFGFELISGWWSGEFPPIYIFETCNQICHSSSCISELQFLRHISWTNKKIWQLGFPKSYKVFTKPSYTIVAPYLIE